MTLQRLFEILLRQPKKKKRIKKSHGESYETFMSRMIDYFSKNEAHVELFQEGNGYCEMNHFKW